jgi:hypothetical protein
VSVEAAEVERQAATTDLSGTETMVTTEMAVARSTVGEVVATVVGEEAISCRTTPNRYALRRTTEMLTHRESSILP